MEDGADGNELEAAFIAETTCNICDAEFLHSEDLEVHLQQMHKSTVSPKYCQLCPDTYNDLEEYATHVVDFHLKVLQSCRYCTKCFIDERKWKLHEENHIKNNLFACSLCDYMFREAHHMRYHEEKCHNNDVDGVFLKCLPHLAAALSLKILPLLQSVGPKMYICVMCSFTSISFPAYANHLKTSKCTAVVCNNCCGVYKNKKHLIRHNKVSKKCIRIDEYMDKLVVCEECNESVHPMELRNHLKLCKSFRCVHCTVVCNSMDELSLHQMKEHAQGMDIIRCLFCSKEFIGSPPLKKHVRRVHKPHFHLYKYKCVTCSTIFPHPQKLFAHYYIHHKDLQPFHCRICDKTFRLRKSFTLHIKLDHKSVGFVEFDQQYHVFFTKNKSEIPFIPKSVISQKMLQEFESDEEDVTTNMDLIETDVETENEKAKLLKKSKPIKRVKKKQLKTEDPEVIYSSDEEPLMQVRKKALKARRRHVRTINQQRGYWTWKKNVGPKNLYICKKCNKNCYTFQNYQNHMNTHSKSMIKCVKCLQEFQKRCDLMKHINKEHATSKLTETLKNLIKKKQEGSEKETNKTPEKFTIKMIKVRCEKSGVSAKITPVEKNLSVKNFLENFTPDVNEEKDKVKINSAVVIKHFEIPFHRESSIKMTKFKNFVTTNPVSLKIPERFKPDNSMKTKINIKMVQTPEKEYILPDIIYDDHFHDYEDGKEIPDVAEEVSLEGTEEPPHTQAPTKIVLPKSTKGYSKFHVATLQAEAPFFKILKIENGTVTEKKNRGSVAMPPKSDIINLPGGKKLVTANPLAHLLGNKPIEELMDKPHKRYQPVIKDFQGMLASAMRKLEEIPPPKKRKVTKKTTLESK